MTKPKIRLPKAELAAFCERWQITKLALFGSVVSDDEDFGPQSTVEVIARFGPNARHGLFALNRMERELAELLAREVHLVSWRGLEHSAGPHHRKRILDSVQVVYAA